MSSFQLEVVTPERSVVTSSVECVLLPSEGGQLGILANHAPLIASLGIGIVEFGKKQGPKRKLAVSGGFAEMNQNILTLMVQSAELAEEIDVLRAKEAKERAESRIRDKQVDFDLARIEIALKKAVNRLKVADYQE